MPAHLAHGKSQIQTPHEISKWFLLHYQIIIIITIKNKRMTSFKEQHKRRINKHMKRKKKVTYSTKVEQRAASPLVNEAKGKPSFICKIIISMKKGGYGIATHVLHLKKNERNRKKKTYVWGNIRMSLYLWCRFGVDAKLYFFKDIYPFLFFPFSSSVAPWVLVTLWKKVLSIGL